MAIGTILDVPTQYSSYARVRSEYGEEVTVHGSEIPRDASVGEELAYYVDIWQNETGDVATIRSGKFEGR